VVQPGGLSVETAPGLVGHEIRGIASETDHPLSRQDVDRPAAPGRRGLGGRMAARATVGQRLVARVTVAA